MPDITVTLSADEALFVLAALERHAKAAYRDARGLIEHGAVDGDQLLDIAMTTALNCEAANRRIADALYPPDPLAVILRDDVADEIELGLS